MNNHENQINGKSNHKENNSAEKSDLTPLERLMIDINNPEIVGNLMKLRNRVEQEHTNDLRKFGYAKWLFTHHKIER